MGDEEMGCLFFLLIAVVAFFLYLIVLGGASYYEKESYLLHNITVEYTRETGLGDEDDLKFEFRQDGEFRVEFSIPDEEEGRDRDKLPDSFTITVEGQAEKTIRQQELPARLEITITNLETGAVEEHDYR